MRLGLALALPMTQAPPGGTASATAGQPIGLLLALTKDS